MQSPPDRGPLHVGDRVQTGLAFLRPNGRKLLCRRHARSEANLTHGREHGQPAAADGVVMPRAAMRIEDKNIFSILTHRARFIRIWRNSALAAGDG